MDLSGLKRVACLVAVTACLALLSACGGAEPFELLPTPPVPKVSVVLSADTTVSDPERGRLLFEKVPAPSLLACYDCHSDDPIKRNFGNIWVGKNAPNFIARAINLNTGGMGYFSGYFNTYDLADIAAYLGVSPGRLSWAAHVGTGQSNVGPAYEPKVITIYAGTKSSIEQLRLSVSDNYAIVSSDCGSTVQRFTQCQVSLAPRTDVLSDQPDGELLISHVDAPRPVRVRLYRSSGT